MLFTGTAAAALVGLSAPLAGAASGAREPQQQPDPTHTWDRRGPYEVDVRVDALTTYYFPRDPASLGRELPVVLWGNGTFGIPGVYRGLLMHWASYGFIVAAANTTQAFTGLEMLAGLNALEAEHAKPGARFHGCVDLRNVCSSGHSQGGGGALNAALDRRVTSVLPIQPGPLATVDWLSAPLLLLTGSQDAIVYPPLWVLPFFYERAKVPTVYASLKNAGHMASVFTKDGGRFRSLTTAWHLARLSGDARAKQVFGGEFRLAAHPEYVDVRRNQRAGECL